MHRLFSQQILFFFEFVFDTLCFFQALLTGTCALCLFLEQALQLPHTRLLVFQGLPIHLERVSCLLRLFLELTEPQHQLLIILKCGGRGQDVEHRLWQAAGSRAPGNCHLW